MSIIKLNFCFEFFEKNSIFPFYNSVYNNSNNQTLLNDDLEGSKIDKKHIYVVNCIPPYFDLGMNKDLPFKAIKTSLRRGFLINLDGYYNLEDYLKNQLGSKRSKKMRSGIRRLETCFDIQYKMFFGEIEKDEYLNLMDNLEMMIKKRFSQKNKEHTGLKNWNSYVDKVYSLILYRKASLFTIYDDKKPIVIGIGFHSQNIFNSAITSYDIDYSKFGLGNIAVVKKLEWCFQNKFDILDMLWGELDYKKQWCNVIHDYESHILYNDQMFFQKIAANFIGRMLLFKKYLLKKGILPFDWIKQFQMKSSIKVEDANQNYESTNVEGLPSIENLQQIEINNVEYAFLKKAVYDFQYATSQNSKQVKVFKSRNDEKTYFISGKGGVLKLFYHF